MPDAHTYIDLRSDTVTFPTDKMRHAMANAALGDDVYGEDPTVNRLEAQAAKLFAKEAALFVPTGTMGNNIAIKMHTSHGEEVICESRSHILDWELSMMAWFCGCLARPIASPSGLLTWKQIAPVLRGKGPHNAPTTLISLENTHNMAGGTVYAVSDIDEICANAHERGVKVHIDGARIFNASVASHTPVSRIARDADSVMFCLSKGLGAPIGSLLVGTAGDMARARLYRKRLGGGMRQAGVLAAAGLLALEESPLRLHEDHEKAQMIASILKLDPAAVQTNIIIFDISKTGMTTSQFSAELQKKGVLANGINATHMRMVTHQDVSTDKCREAAEIAASLTLLSSRPQNGPGAAENILLR